MKKNALFLKQRRRDLRRKATPAEKHLWNYLRQRRLLGWKFVRQYSIDSFILDFYCPQARLAIELDGGHHNQPTQREYDQARTAYLNHHGIRVLRFWNHEAHYLTDAVLAEIVRGLERPLGESGIEDTYGLPPLCERGG